jgi:prepilin-type N-terminal cleavage/methylation domain-containing protein
VGAHHILNRRGGFTLIELSIVLVIIGLIVGGVLVGQSLISAAAVRAQISQVEKYNQAANTFFGKYGYLPGDIPAGPAAQFGLTARGSLAGEGDGNGILQGINVSSGTADGTIQSTGETTMFWVDLSAVNLIDGSFSTASPSTPITASVTGSALNNWFPVAKVGQGNYVYAYSFNGNGFRSRNYFGLSAVSLIPVGGAPTSSLALTVQQAYNIDKKIDDGLPGTGTVIATYIASGAGIWFAGLGSGAWVGTAANPASATTCFDNGNNAGTTQTYSVEVSNGSNVNCAISFQMQAGD